ncbi:hypothetical protein ABIA35_009167 [Catenulispora sp. MAP12-49]|uniref:hypothetical protein n=1 Tax=Catenulispora sp. MAP12-49 TaxID=3156302 RepID=UPI003510DC72
MMQNVCDRVWLRAMENGRLIRAFGAMIAAIRRIEIRPLDLGTLADRHIGTDRHGGGHE